MITAIIAFVVSLLVAVVGDLVSEEFRSRLEKLPRCVLRIAAWQLPREHREARYEEWLGELEHGALREKGLPLTGLATGLAFAVGHVKASGSLRDALRWETPRWVWAVRYAAASICLSFGVLAIFVGVGSFISLPIDRQQASAAVMAVSVTSLMVSIALTIYRLRGSRVTLWFGMVTLIGSSYGINISGRPLSRIELVWLLLAALGLVSAIVGTCHRTSRRVASAAMLPFPLMTAVLAFDIFREWFANGITTPLWGTSIVIALAIWSINSVTRYGAEVVGKQEWSDGTRPLSWDGGDLTWSRIAYEVEAELGDYRTRINTRMTKMFHR